VSGLIPQGKKETETTVDYNEKSQGERGRGKKVFLYHLKDKEKEGRGALTFSRNAGRRRFWGATGWLSGAKGKAERREREENFPYYLGVEKIVRRSKKRSKWGKGGCAPDKSSSFT